jgi:hypothetical protein
MSHAAATTHDHDVTLRDLAGKLPVVPNAQRRLVWVICMAVGLITFGALLFVDPRRAWGAYAVNMLYWMGMAQGAVVLAAAIRLCNGRWGGPVMRVAEALSAYLPYGYGAVVVMLVAGIWTYLPWVHHVAPRQAPYLNVPFLYIRTLAGLGLLAWLSRDLVRTSLRLDAQRLKPHVSPELRADYDKLTANWRGDAAEQRWAHDRLAMRSPQIVLCFAVVYTFLAWDWILSLTPDYSNQIFGWWFFMGSFLNGIAMTAFLSTRLRSQYRLEDYITPNHFWDLGKIAFGFSIFWVYEFWSQYLPVWYANLPDETWWMFLRFENPWRPLAFTVFGFVFLLPFLGLMNWYTKKSPFWLALFALIIMSGMWMERHILIMPSLNPRTVWVGLPEIGVSIGFLGMFGWAVQRFVSRWPVVKITDVLEGAGAGH